MWAAVDYEAVNFSTVKMSIQNQTSGSNLRIRDAHHLWLEIIPPVGRRVDVALPPKRRWSDWPIGGIWPGTTIEIVDSVVDHAAAYRGGGSYLENCEVRCDIEVKSRDAVVYAHNLRPSPYGPINILELDGGRHVELDEPGVPW